MMRVLHRINLDVAGGVENQFRAFVAHPAVRAALRHDVVIGSAIHKTLQDDIQHHVDAIDSIKRANGARLPRWPRRLRDNRFVELAAIRRPDVMLSWSAFARPGLTQAAQHHRVPLVYREGGAAWREADRKAARSFLDTITGAVCNSHASMRMLQLRWGYRGPARVCLGGLRNSIAAAAPTPRATVGQRRIVLGMAGRLVLVKGMVLALHAVAALRQQGFDVEMRIAGDGPLRTKLTRMARRLGIGARVQFEGAVETMATFYAGIDIFVHTALREPLGNVCIEAAAMGCVVVATRVDGLAETVTHGGTGIVLAPGGDLDDYKALGGDTRDLPEQVYDPDTDTLRAPRCVMPDKLAAAIATLITDSATLARMSAQAIIATRERFDFDRYAQEMIAALYDYAGQPEHRLF